MCFLQLQVLQRFEHYTQSKQQFRYNDKNIFKYTNNSIVYDVLIRLFMVILVEIV